VEDALAFLQREHPREAATAAWARAVLLGSGHELEERVYRGWDGLGYVHDVAGYVGGIFPRPGEVAVFFEHGARLRAGGAPGLVPRGRRGAVVLVRATDAGTAAVLEEVLDRAVQLGLLSAADRSR
jgi:hypothetical protein